MVKHLSALVRCSENREPVDANEDWQSQMSESIKNEGKNERLVKCRKHNKTKGEFGG